MKAVDVSTSKVGRRYWLCDPDLNNQGHVHVSFDEPTGRTIGYNAGVSSGVRRFVVNRVLGKNRPRGPREAILDIQQTHDRFVAAKKWRCRSCPFGIEGLNHAVHPVCGSHRNTAVPTSYQLAAFRPPYGQGGIPAFEWAREDHIKHRLTDVDTKDWRHHRDAFFRRWVDDPAGHLKGRSSLPSPSETCRV